MPSAIAALILNFRYGGINQGVEQRPVQLQGTDETCGLVENDDGTWAILSPNGQQWVSIQPNGKWESRDARTTEPGVWERFTRSGNVLTELAKDGEARPLVQLVVVDRQGALPSPVPSGEHGPLHTRGSDFVDEHDQPWQLRGYTMHLLMCRIKDDEDVTPVLDEAKGYGANTIVTIGTHLSDWKKDHGFYLNPRDPGYANLLARMFDWCALSGLRVAHAALADCQRLTAADKHWIWDLTCEVSKGRWNVLLRIGNEWPANDWWPGDFHLPDLGGVLASRGSSGINNPPWPDVWHWAEWEPPRSPMPKAMGDSGPGMLYLSEGYRDEASGQMIGPFRCPLVCIEPPYFHETPRDQYGDERWTDPQWALRLGGNIGVNCAGGAFGSSASLEAEPNGPIAAACARAFFTGLIGSWPHA